MDVSSIMKWAVFIFIFAAPIVFFLLRSRIREKRAFLPLKAFAAENHTVIAQCDSWDKTLIGIDGKDLKTLFFIRDIPGYKIREKIHLADVSGCRLYKVERKAKYNKEMVEVIDRLGLMVSFYDHRPELGLEFYNVDYDELTLSGELQLAGKWAAEINAYVAPGKRWNAPKKETVLAS